MYHLALVSLLGAAQGLMLVVVFLRLPLGNRLANRLLSCFIGVQTLRLFLYYFLYETAFADWPWIYLALNLNLTAGPLVYLYIQCLTTPNFSLRWPMAWHFLPMLVFALGSAYWVSIHGLEVGLLRDWMWDSVPGADYDEGDEVYALSIMVGLIYSYLACRLLWRHGSNIREQFSDIENIHLGWLWIFLLLFVLGGLASLVHDILILVLQMNIGPRMVVALIVASTQIYYIAYFGLRQQAVYEVETTTKGDRLSGSDTRAPLAQLEQSAETSTKTADHDASQGTSQKYQKSSLTGEQSEAIWQSLLEAMQTTKPYLESGINLTQLAQSLNVSNDHMTQVISHHAEKNFYDFINDYRIESAKQLLACSENGRTPLLHIALDCGFSSQSSFSTRFKRATGQTPSQYRNAKSSA